MVSQTSKDRIEFLSADQTTTIVGYVWSNTENKKPQGIVQLVHGMAEYISRYDEFARYLVDRGFVVCGHDHLGHGQSVNDTSEWGCLPMKDGAKVLVEDVHQLRTLIQQRYGEQLPYIVFGHSMGSFVVRNYIAQYGLGLAGAIVCGTGQMPLALSRSGNLLCRAIAKLRGPKHRSKLMDSMGAGGYGKNIKDARTPLDWLSYNTQNVDAYIADEQCGFMFSVSGYAAVTSLTETVALPECVDAVPKKLPVLFVAGEEDPVGDCGEGVKAACKAMVEAGVEDVGLKLYPHMRHEILNEDGKAEVMDDIYQWIEARI